VLLLLIFVLGGATEAGAGAGAGAAAAAVMGGGLKTEDGLAL
jgi:hypothetical protein